jgi:hypothetical protein
MSYPTRPSNPNGFQILGTLLSQGGQLADQIDATQQADEDRKNRLALLMQDMADKKAAAEMLRIKAAREAADEAAKTQARADITGLMTNGVRVPGDTTTIPESTLTVSTSPDMQDLQSGRPNALLGYNAKPVLSQVTTPASTVVTPDTFRPATMEDYQKAILPAEDPGTFVKNLTPPNKAAAMSSVASLIRFANTTKDKIIKGSDLDAAALAGDPTAAILSDKQYLNLKKTYATDVQAQDSETRKTNSDTAIKRAGIAQQNADSYAKRLAQNQTVNMANPDNIKMIAEDLADGSLRIEKLPFLLGRSDKNSGARLQAYQMAKQINPSFDPSEYEREFKAYENNGNQKALAQIAAVRPNIDAIVKLSNDVPRLGMPSVNAAIMKGKYLIGDTPVTTLEEMRHALADELGTALSRSGNFSDAKLALARDLLHTDISASNFATNMELLKHMLDNNEKAIRAPMGHYGNRSGNPGTSPAKPKSDPLGLF